MSSSKLLAQSLIPDSKGNLPPLWFLLGSEPLLTIEAQDAIRAAAKSAGYTERKSFVFEGNADFSPLYEALGDQSLFGEKNLIEVVFPRSTIGKTGPEAVKAIIEHADEDKMIVVSLLEYDWTTEKKDWFIQLSSKALRIPLTPVPRSSLSSWIIERAQLKNQQTLSKEAAEFIAEKTEGNLLATSQEINKLALLCDKTEVSREDVIDAVSDVSRFDQEALRIAMLEGDAGKVSRVIESLEAESVQIPSFLWMLAEDVRRLLLMKQGLQVQMFLLSDAHKRALRYAATRASVKRLEVMLHRLSDVDRMSKGLFVETSDGSPWQELKAACLMLSLKRK